MIMGITYRLKLALILFFMLCTVLHADDITQGKIDQTVLYPKTENQENSSASPLLFYQQYISPVIGDRCPMYPSCSQYSRKAIKKHGMILGIIMTCDRLIRCGRDETRLAPAVFIDHEKYTHDSVDQNDFWHSK